MWFLNGVDIVSNVILILSFINHSTKQQRYVTDRYLFLKLCSFHYIAKLKYYGLRKRFTIPGYSHEWPGLLLFNRYCTGLSNKNLFQCLLSTARFVSVRLYCRFLCGAMYFYLVLPVQFVVHIVYDCFMLSWHIIFVLLCLSLEEICYVGLYSNDILVFVMLNYCINYNFVGQILVNSAYFIIKSIALCIIIYMCLLFQGACNIEFYLYERQAVLCMLSYYYTIYVLERYLRRISLYKVLKPTTKCTIVYYVKFLSICRPGITNIYVLCCTLIIKSWKTNELVTINIKLELQRC